MPRCRKGEGWNERTSCAVEVAALKRVVREMIRHNGELHGKISALEAEVTRLREALENFMAYGKDLIRREGPTGVEGGFFESLEIAREALAATPAKPAEPSHTILPVCLICRRNQKEHEQGNGCGRPVYGTVAATFYLRDDRVVIEGPAKPLQHGVDCLKQYHIHGRGGYLHDADDDRPYDVDGVMYCGRCHVALPAEGSDG